MTDDARTRLAADRRRAIGALPTAITPELVAATTALIVPTLDPSLGEGTRLHADLGYGGHERQVLDVYAPAIPDRPRPVIVYVHGGWFVGGGKSRPDSPYFGNLGGWAVRHGMVAVVPNYRLAPEVHYPSGAEDLRLAVAWIRAEITGHGGDPDRIVLVGQSAGAMHVADAVTGAAGPIDVAGAVLVSGLYDLGRVVDSPNARAYWGDDRSAWAERATLDRLVDLDLPLAFTVGEYDDAEFQDHAAQLVSRWAERRGGFAPMHLLPGHNHLSPAYAIGSPVDELGDLLRGFVAGL